VLLAHRAVCAYFDGAALDSVAGKNKHVSKQTKQLTVGGRRVPVSNLDKILYPGGKFTKADVIDFYIRISKYLLPHLRNHPVTLKRFA
jgi:hypothetical protein